MTSDSSVNMTNNLNLPWHYDGVHIKNSCNEIVCSFWDEDNHAPYLIDNAAYICKAANMHHELISLVTDLLADIHPVSEYRARLETLLERAKG